MFKTISCMINSFKFQGFLLKPFLFMYFKQNIKFNLNITVHLLYICIKNNKLLYLFFSNLNTLKSLIISDYNNSLM